MREERHKSLVQKRLVSTAKRMVTTKWMSTEIYTIMKAAGEVGDCAAKSLIETFGKSSKDQSYTESIMRGTLGSLYVGRSTTFTASG